MKAILAIVATLGACLAIYAIGYGHGWRDCLRMFRR